MLHRTRTWVSDLVAKEGCTLDSDVGGQSESRESRVAVREDPDDLGGIGGC
jgi:hypothetical protein